MALLSKLLLYEKVKPEEIEDALGYGARSLGYSELKVELFQASFLVGRDHDSAISAGSPWSELHPLPSRIPVV